jgi:hypothetical protein
MTTSGYGSLAHQARSKHLKSAKIILWFVGLLTACVSGFRLANVEDEVDAAFRAELAKQGLTMQTIDRGIYDKARAEAVGKLKLGYGADVAIGLIFIGCALLVNRKPVIATVSGLVLFLGATAVIAAMDPKMLGQGVIMRVAIIFGLIGAVKAAIAVERQERAELGA